MRIAITTLILIIPIKVLQPVFHVAPTIVATSTILLAGVAVVVVGVSEEVHVQELSVTFTVRHALQMDCDPR